MRKQLASVGIGCVIGVLGLMLWLATGDIETPIISLPKVGVVLAVVGGIEVLVSGASLVLPSTRHRDDER